MCNYCNSGTSGCGCGCGNSFWNCGYQRLCRDCCGNIHVRQGCGCNSCGCNDCGCNGCTNNDAGGAQGGFTCVTFCGNANASTTNATSANRCGYQSSATNGTDWYYARQYGLLPYGGCSCGSGYSYDTVTQTTT